MENHEEACARVAAHFSTRWLRHYALNKLRRDPVFAAAGELLRESRLPLLDVGCGIGLLPLYLRARGFAAPVIGIDIDARKIRHARAATSVEFIEGDVCCDLPPFQGNVALFDVLHYLSPDRQAALLREVVLRVAPEGMVLLRDCPRDGSLRYWVTYAGELFAQAISWNIGTRLFFPTRKAIDTAFSATEFTRDERPMYAGSPFNNRLFIFRRSL